MIEIKNEMLNIIEDRKSKYIEDDAGIQDCWNRMILILSQDEDATIAYLQECSEEELDWISEVFEDISEKLNSHQFIKCLRALDKKYPKLGMTKDIDLAEDYLQ